MTIDRMIKFQELINSLVYYIREYKVSPNGLKLKIISDLCLELYAFVDTATEQDILVYSRRVIDSLTDEYFQVRGEEYDCLDSH